MNIDQAVLRACEEPTLLDAINWICIWESERAIKQATEYQNTVTCTGANDAGWDTCFKTCLRLVMEWYPKHGTKQRYTRMTSNPVTTEVCKTNDRSVTDHIKSDEGCRQYIEQAFETVFENEAPDIQFLAQTMADVVDKIQNTVCKLPDAMLTAENTTFYTVLKLLQELDLRIVLVRGKHSNPVSEIVGGDTV